MIQTKASQSVFLPILALLLLMAGCTETVSIQLEPEVDAYVVTDSQTKIRLVETDSTYIELNNWLQENQTGWHNTAGRFPGGVYIKSGVNGIQVTGMEVIVYSTAGSEPDAKFVRHVGKTELSSVRKIGQ